MAVVSVESPAPSSSHTHTPSPSPSGQSLTAQGGLFLLKQTFRVWKLLWISSSSKCEGKTALRSHRPERWCSPFWASLPLPVFPVQTCLEGC